MAWWCHQIGPLNTGLSSGFVSLHVSQHSSSYQPSVTPQPVPEAGPASNACPSEENQNQQPPQAAAQPQPHGASQEAGGYMLTPNAPALYGPSYSPFEKPPPYACWAQRPRHPAPCSCRHSVGDLSMGNVELRACMFSVAAQCVQPFRFSLDSHVFRLSLWRQWWKGLYLHVKWKLKDANVAVIDLWLVSRAL